MQKERRERISGMEKGKKRKERACTGKEERRERRERFGSNCELKALLSFLTVCSEFGSERHSLLSVISSQSHDWKNSSGLSKMDS